MLRLTIFNNLKNYLSIFFYYLSKTSIVAKLRSNGRIIASIYDLSAVIVAWSLACWVLIDTMADVSVLSFDKTTRSLLLVSLYWKPVLFYLICLLPPQFLLFWFFGLYRGFWRFASIQDLSKILYASLLGGLITWVELRINTTPGLLGQAIFESPYSNMPDTSHLVLLPRYIAALLYSIFLIAFLTSARLFVRFAKNYKHIYGDYDRVIIVGAGKSGEGLVRDLLRDDSNRYKPIIFVDDKSNKIGREIHGIRVAGVIAELPKLIAEYNIDLVLIAIPTASSAKMRSVVGMCEKANVRCYTLPGIKDLANGRVSINILRSISLEDLLGRYPVTCQWSSVKDQLKNKTVLVTGGGGSIGSELCRQIASLGEMTRLVIVDCNEYNLYTIDMELRRQFPSCQLHPILLNVTDRAGVASVLREYKPKMVFHAAAYKHVPLLENQPRIAVFNNIIGTRIIAEEASSVGVETFVLISTDKAVNPTNIMGATKRAAEYFCQNLNSHTRGTRFITVRFGNVLDSAGSVVPLFRKQIESGGPVTVTHPEITRFFMTIPEASQLILQSAFLGQGGEIFVLDMGDPIKIRYLAEQMIKMTGKIVEQDIKIVYSGLRPGEKLYEECFYPNETLQPTTHAKILRAQSKQRDFEEIKQICSALELNCHLNNVHEIIILLKNIVPEYQTTNNDHEPPVDKCIADEQKALTEIS